MAEILTESFCERCGTRYTFESNAPKPKRIGRFKVLSKGFRNFVMSENRIPQGDLYAEMSEEGLTVKDGKLKVPDGPGLGITLRPEVMNEFIENGRWE